VSGTAINFLALGVTGYFFIQVYGENGTPGSISQVPSVNIPGIDRIGFIGPVFGHLNLMIWLMFLAVILTSIVVFRTPIRLRLRPAVLCQALPYVWTLIAVAGVIGRSSPPAASGRPYRKQ